VLALVKGTRMLNRWSVNALLKSVIVVMSAAIVLMLLLGAWSAYERLGTTNRVVALTRTSGLVFQALGDMRRDRTFTDRR